MNFVYSQQRVCSTNEFMIEKMKDSIFKIKYNKRQAAFQKKYKELKLNFSKKRTDTIIIPVAVHFPTAEESIRECLVDLAKDQVRILNEDFSATNSDFSKWTEANAVYPNINSGKINVKFILATKNHPANTDEELLEGEPAVTIGWLFDESDSDLRWAGYQNFVVKPLGGSVLGYSQLGGDSSNGDAVVITSTAFGSGTGCSGFSPEAPFNFGRTTTHELGHYYNLDHTWGGSGSCNLDDEISDTPNISEPTYGCVLPGSVNMCGNISLTTNYMDYVNDECMFMFTEGQAMKMNAYLALIQNRWKANVIENEIDTEVEDPTVILEKEFDIFPNPANDNINISFPKDKITEASYSLYNILGKVVLNKIIDFDNETSEIKINTSQLNNGIYILNFKSSAFSKIKRIIVKH